MATRPDGSRFVVAQQTAIRDEIAGDLAIRALVPIAALIPGLMLVTAFVISRSFRPVERLAARLNARQANHLHKLPIEDNLRELHPFIASINGLLDRIRLMVGQQSRFIADAAHELRTPVTALSLQAENLDSVSLPDGYPHALGHTEGGHRTHQASARTNTRTRPPRHAPIRRTWARCARPGCKEADPLPEACERGLDLGFEIIEAAPVKAEPVMLAAMTRNLLDNALRFTPRGGRIDLGIYRESETIILQVEDTGPGIPAVDIERIFEPFYRGSRSGGDGSGLGLSIVKRIVDNLGASSSKTSGAAGAASAPGSGHDQASLGQSMIPANCEAVSCSNHDPKRAGDQTRPPSRLTQAARTVSRNLPTSSFSRLLSLDSDCAAASTCEEAVPVSLAPRCTSVMLAETC
jgi:two-component system, OmpR family, sensor kinase